MLQVVLGFWEIMRLIPRIGFHGAWQSSFNVGIRSSPASARALNSSKILGDRVAGSGLQAWGTGFRLQALGSRVQSSRFALELALVQTSRIKCMCNPTAVFVEHVGIKGFWML